MFYTLTLAVWKRTPFSIVQAGNTLKSVTTGEGKTCITLEPGEATVGHIGGLHRESIVNLRHRSTVDLLTGGDVGLTPLSSKSTLSFDLRHTSGKHLAHWTPELDLGPKQCVHTAGDGSSSGLQWRTVGRVDGRETVILPAVVRHKLDVQFARVCRESDVGGQRVCEAVTRMEFDTILSIEYLQKKINISNISDLVTYWYWRTGLVPF